LLVQRPEGYDVQPLAGISTCLCMINWDLR
jgi:hypothetical protein